MIYFFYRMPVTMLQLFKQFSVVPFRMNISWHHIIQFRGFILFLSEVKTSVCEMLSDKARSCISMNFSDEITTWDRKIIANIVSIDFRWFSNLIIKMGWSFKYNSALPCFFCLGIIDGKLEKLILKNNVIVLKLPKLPIIWSWPL